MGSSWERPRQTPFALAVPAARKWVLLNHHQLTPQPARLNSHFFIYIYITLASKFDQIAGYNPYPNISHQPGEMITAPEQLRDPSSKL